MKLIKYIFLIVSLLTFSCEAQVLINNGSGVITPYSPTESKVQTILTNAAGGGALTTAEATAVRRFAEWLVISGNADFILSFKPMMGFSTEAKATQEWFGASDATGTGSYTLAGGCVTDGSTNTIGAGFTPSTQGTYIDGASSRDDIYIGVYLISNDHGGATGDLFGASGASTSNQTRLNQIVTSNNITYKVNLSATATDAAAGPFASGKWHAAWRNQSSRQGRHIDFDQGSINLQASAGNLNRSLVLGGFDNNGTISSRFAGHFGSFLACSANRFNFADFFVHWSYMMQELGALSKEALYPWDLPLISYKSTEAFLVAMHGQSNQSGRATARNIKLILPLDALVAWRNPPLMITPFTALQQLQFGVNNNMDNLSENGTELRIGYELPRLIGGQVCILKHSQNATALVDGLTSPDWNVTSNELSNIAFNVIDIPAMQIIDDTYTIKTIVFDWNQSEAEAASGGVTQVAYETAWIALFKYFIDQVEAAGYTFGSNNIRLHVVLRKIYTSIPNSTTVRAAMDNMQTAFVAAHPTYASKIQSWTVFNSDGYYYSDGVHMSSFGIECDGIKKGLFYSRK